MAVDGEFGGFDIQLLGDVLADLDQVGAAAADALAGFGFVDMDDARQVGRQRLPPGFDARLARGGRLGLPREPLQLLLDGGLVGNDGLVEQVALPGGGQCLALLAEADALVVGQFEGEGLDFKFGGLQGHIAEGDGLPGQFQFVKQPVQFVRSQNRHARQGGKGVQWHRHGG